MVTLEITYAFPKAAQPAAAAVIKEVHRFKVAPVHLVDRLQWEGSSPGDALVQIFAGQAEQPVIWPR